CNQGLRLDPNDSAALDNRAAVLLRQQRYEDAAAAYLRLLDVAPDHPYGLGAALHTQMHSCDWHDHAANWARLRAALGRGLRATWPLPLIALSDSAAEQRRCTEQYAADECAPARGPGLGGAGPYAHDRIRIAYLSADLRVHPVAYLMAELFEQHDRARFET